MSDGSDRTTVTDGYVVPIAGLMALLFAVMAGLTAPRAFSGEPTEALLPIGFAVGSLAALRLSQRHAAANADADAEMSDDETA
ncbi:hypothetical protein C471_14243 [Halorubrum saccharovorum DSM 1137]|uniref:Uncharacterized protein n=1 Tax=Halorubrum saccharovorum DSM 1137 TaxID=1227484 RepID=M0DRH7_9EURY|nr:hypothetical protein [Halorubrum saccharovorum]ELZ36749.1 hypothetical protein C471_14243 [Halorubrum saccharovorum DSM 1137]